MTRRIWHLPPIAAALLWAACGDEDPHRGAVLRSLDELIATCSAISGPVQVKRRGEGFWSTAAVGAVFRPGDWVRSGAGGYARVEFLASGALELDENATVILDVQEAEPAADGGTPGGKAALVAVEEGAVRGVMQASADGGTATPLMFATADGKRGQIEASAGGGPVEFSLARRERKTEVAVSSGEATLAYSGERRTLRSGIIEELDLGKLVEVILLKPPALGGPRHDARLLFRAGTPVALSWEPVAGATGYQVQISRDPTFRDKVQSRVVEGPEYGFVAGEAASYSWRVATRERTGRPGAYSAPRRVHLEATPPSDHLEEPEPGAVFGYAGDAIRVAFRWRPASGAEQYQVVIARSRDLGHDQVASEPAHSASAEMGALTPGSYYWGVYAREGDGTRPLHLRARPLVVKRVSASTLRAPKKVQSWGE